VGRGTVDEAQGVYLLVNFFNHTSIQSFSD
jgi:conserved oligomeric Golgi complex subunit 4